MTIQVVIVDDSSVFAKYINECIELFCSKLPGITYDTKIFHGIDVVVEAVEYVKAYQENIDLFLVDYNIDSSFTGIDLFRLIDSNRFLTYNILHSVTTRSQTLARANFRLLYDEFCTTKDEEDILACLKHFEEKILFIKLFGRPEFADLVYSKKLSSDEGFNTKNVSNFEVKRAASEIAFENVGFIDILYVESKGSGTKEFQVAYRDTNEGRIVIKPVERAISINKFVSQGLAFRRVSSSLVINLLWVAKIEALPNIIRFIALDNSKIELSYIPTALFDGNLRDEIGKMSKLPDYFTK